MVLSFSGWQHLTSLPVANGLVYFAASLVVQMASIGTSHDGSIGCVNDFLWDKRDVDAVKAEGVMAQVEMACGSFRIVSLMSREAAAEELGLRPGVRAEAVPMPTHD